MEKLFGFLGSNQRGLMAVVLLVIYCTSGANERLIKAVKGEGREPDSFNERPISRSEIMEMRDASVQDRAAIRREIRAVDDAWRAAVSDANEKSAIRHDTLEKSFAMALASLEKQVTELTVAVRELSRPRRASLSPAWFVKNASYTWAER